MAVVTLMYRP